MRERLNPQVKYLFRDNFEVSWKFAWDRVGITSGWFGWRRAPGEEWKALGVFAEEEIVRRLTEHSRPLTDDDRIDLDTTLRSMLD